MSSMKTVAGEEGTKKDPAMRGLSKVLRKRKLSLLFLCSLFLFLWSCLFGLFNGLFFLLHHGRKS